MPQTPEMTSAIQKTRPTPSRREAVVDLVREFYAEKGDTAASKSTRRNQGPMLTFLAVVVCVAAWVVPSFIPDMYSGPPSEAALDRSARLSLYLANLRVREFQRSAGRVPLNLTDARVEDSAIYYSRLSDSTYLLSTVVSGKNITYHSSNDIRGFLGPAASLVAPR